MCGDDAGRKDGRMKEINTPIYDFVSEYIDSDFARLHMPGHKGRGPLGCEEREDRKSVV